MLNYRNILHERHCLPPFPKSKQNKKKNKEILHFHGKHSLSLEMVPDVSQYPQDGLAR